MFWRTARALHRPLASSRLTASDLRLPRLATVDLAGWMVTGSVSRGKHLLLRLRPADEDPPMTLHSHLGMDGSCRLYAAGEEPRGRSRHQIRVVLRTADAVAVGYQFFMASSTTTGLQRVAFVPTSRMLDVVGHLGQTCSERTDTPARRSGGCPAGQPRPWGRPCVTSTTWPGIGNVYCCELLSCGGAWPWTPVQQVNDLPALGG
jgi:endonuclease-8